MTATPWAERPREEARLLNPAFLGALLWNCANSYAATAQESQPYALSFLVAPIILHKNTREKLPGTTRTILVRWLNDNPQILVGFTDRAKILVPLVKKAVLFAACGGLIKIQMDRVVAGPRPRSMAGFERKASQEVKACMKKAEFLGKWFALSGEYTTIMALWGVAP